MSINNDTLIGVPEDLSDPEVLRNFLLLLVQQMDIIIGNRKISVTPTYTKVEPSAGYTQSEAVQIANDLKALYDKVGIVEAKLTPANN